MGEERARKLRKLNGLRRSLPSMSVSAFTSFLKEAQQGDLPTLAERKHVKEATLHALPGSVYGPMLLPVQVKAKQLPNKKAKEFEEVVIVNTLTLLQAAYGQGGSFYKLICDTLHSSPCSLDCPWNILLYCDEVQPGQTLGIHGGRKCWMIYLGILEFGVVALSQELSWMPICAVPTNVVAGIEAGISQVFVKVLEQIFSNPLCHVGSGLRLKGEATGDACTLYLQLGGLIQDGQAQRQVFNTKGDSGSRLCMMCCNLYSERSAICGDDNVLTCKLMGGKELVQSSDEDIKQSIRKLVEQKSMLNKSEFKLWQQSCGFTYEPYGLLFSTSVSGLVKPVSHYIHDWMHCIAVNGVFHTVFYHWLEAVSHFQDAYSFLHEYLQSWYLPRGKNANLHRLFNDKRKVSNLAGSTFKCSASEVLGLLPILCFYTQQVLLPSGICCNECKVVTQAALEEAVAAFYSTVRQAKWEHISHSKFHWLQHLGAEMARLNNRLPSCWCHESKRKHAKQFAEYIQNTTAYCLLQKLAGRYCCTGSPQPAGR